MDRQTLAPIVVTLIVAAHGNAFAQDTAAVRKALDRLSPGETISVLDTEGSRDGGMFTGLTATKLLIDGMPSKVDPSRITRLTVHDSPANGAKIGAIIGGAAAGVGAVLVGMIRPEVTWSVEPTGIERSRTPVARAGVSIGAAW